MRLARKITLAIGAAILVIMAAHAYFLLRHQVVLFDVDLARSVNLKRRSAPASTRVWEAYGDARPRSSSSTPSATPSRASHVRWTWLDAPPGDPRHLDLPPDQLAQLREGERVIVFRKDDGTTRERYTYVPETLPGKPPAVLEFVESIQRAARLHRGEPPADRRSRPPASCSRARLAVYWLGVWYVGRPIQQLRDRLRAVAGGDFDDPRRAPAERRDRRSGARDRRHVHRPRRGAARARRRDRGAHDAPSSSCATPIA